jgi:glycosyltransferase involved in cell wall biosynthesis
MNILYLCDEYPPCQHGGIGTVTQLLARALVKKGHKVVVAGFYPYYREAANEEIDHGVKVCRFIYGSRLQLQLSKRKYIGNFFNIEKQFNKYINSLKKIIIENHIDVIETPDFVEAFRYTGPRIIQFPDFGIPIIVKLHGTYTFFNHLENIHSISDNIFKKENLHLDNATGIIAISNFTMSETKALFSFRKNAKVIYNGTSCNFPVNYNIEKTSNTVVFAGTLAEKKGIFSLIKAWEEVIRKIPSVKLFIYGKGGDKTIAEIDKLLTTFYKNSIELKGFVTKEVLSTIYASAACAIFPSYAESFSMAPMEAMATGCPVIYTKRSSGPELITNEVDGLLVDPDNIQEIADAIIVMLTDRKRAYEMGLKGAKKIRASFDIDIISEKHINFYNSI